MPFHIAAAATFLPASLDPYSFAAFLQIVEPKAQKVKFYFQDHKLLLWVHS